MSHYYLTLQPRTFLEQYKFLCQYFFHRSRQQMRRLAESFLSLVWISLQFTHRYFLEYLLAWLKQHDLATISIFWAIFDFPLFLDLPFKFIKIFLFPLIHLEWYLQVACCGRYFESIAHFHLQLLRRITNLLVNGHLAYYCDPLYITDPISHYDKIHQSNLHRQQDSYPCSHHPPKYQPQDPLALPNYLLSSLRSSS